jgi:hypothetical protein
VISVHRRLVAIALCLLAYSDTADAQSQERRDTLTLTDAEVAGIDGRQPDRTFVGASTVDAVHRKSLVRFPGAASAIGDKLKAGFKVASAKLLMDYDSYEIAPQGYLSRSGMSQKPWTQNPPRWHLVARPLRRPWNAARQGMGPTFNANIAGLSYWTRWAAGDERADRFPVSYGPTELSSVHPRGEIDVSDWLTNNEFAATAVERFLLVEQSGLLLEKVETYDQRYREFFNAFDWSVATGGNGLRFVNPRLVVTFEAAGPGDSRNPMPAGTRVRDAERNAEEAAQGRPTAALLSAAEFASTAVTAFGVATSAVRSLRSQRVEELLNVGGDSVSPWLRAFGSGDYDSYGRLVRQVLSTPPRYWQGWWIHDDLLTWYLYQDQLPPYVKQHIRDYWTSWLVPDIPTRALFHPQTREAIDYWKETGDWRGRASFFRDGYNYTTSTENFNHTAAMGALLGGNLIGSQFAIEDGRHGLEYFVLKLWSFNDGSTQEMLDHYYYSISVSGQKMIADFAPALVDRLMGRIALDRSMELLAGAYHPALRRCISPSGRTNLQAVLVEQDGIYEALHSMSSRGTLKYLERPFDGTIHGMRIWGYNTPPGRIGMQALVSPWGDAWLSAVLDEKRLPFQETSTETTRGTFLPPLWRRIYLGKHYGLASQDLSPGAVSVIAQWAPSSAGSSTMEDMGTLTLRYVANTPDMATTRGGAFDQAGTVATFQDGNRAIVFTRPLTDGARLADIAGPSGLRSLATVIALWNFRAPTTWELHVNGRPAGPLPLRVQADQVITIRDGVSYIAIRPLPAANLGRKDEVVIGFGGEGVTEPNGAVVRPALTIASHNLQVDSPVDPRSPDWPKLAKSAYGGYVVELGDEAEYGSFEAFSRHIRDGRLRAAWNSSSGVFEVQYQSGPHLMEAGFDPSFSEAEKHYPVRPGEQRKVFRYRRADGEWPYLPDGIERDTPVAQQGTTGRLEKNGAILEVEPGHKAYLIAEPQTGTYTAYNPMPEPTRWSLTLPGPIRMVTAGKVGLLKLTAVPRAGRLSIETALKPNQRFPQMASEIRISGMPAATSVTVNGTPARTIPVDGGFLVSISK